MLATSLVTDEASISSPPPADAPAGRGGTAPVEELCASRSAGDIPLRAISTPSLAAARLSAATVSSCAVLASTSA